MVLNTRKFDNETPAIVAANKVKVLLGVHRDTGLTGAVDWNMLVFEAGKNVGSSVKITGTVLPALGSANKEAIVFGGTTGKIFTFGSSTITVSANCIARLFGDATAGTWEKVSEEPLPEAKANEILNALLEGAVYLGHKGVSWIPTTEQLKRAFIVLVSESGNYTNLGGLVMNPRERALIFHQVDSLGNHAYYKNLITSKYESRVTDGYVYLGLASKTGVPSTFMPYAKHSVLATVAGDYPYHDNLNLANGEVAFFVYTPTSDTTGNWEKQVISSNSSSVAEISNYIKYNSLFLGQQNKDWAPTEQQLSRSFFIYATSPGTYTNMGDLVIADREIAILHHTINSSNEHNYYKLPIKSKYELVTGDGALYLGAASTTGLPSNFNPMLRCFLSARVATTYPYHDGLVVNQGESAMFLYTPTSDTGGNWSKVVIAKRGDIVCAASNATQFWKDIADAQATEALGIGMINNAIALTKAGSKLILSDGLFTMTNTSDTTQVNINKNIEIVGQGISTQVFSNFNGHDIRVNADNVYAIVRNVNVKHSIGLHRKATWQYYDSHIEQYNIWHENVKADTDVPNFIYKHKYLSVAAFDTQAPFRYYAMNVAGSAAGSTSLVNQVTTSHAPIWDGNNLDRRTCLLMPGTYSSDGGLQLRGDRGNRILGLPGYEKLVKISNPTGTLVEPNDIYMFATVNKVNTPQVIEGVNFKRHVNTKFALNMLVKNCYRDDQKIEDYFSVFRIVNVGKHFIHNKLDYAVRPMAFNASKADRWTIQVYGETRENTMVTANTSGYDIIGYNARVINIGIDMGQTAEQDSPTETLRAMDNFDGEIRDIEFVRAGVVRMYSKAAIILLNQKKGRYINVKGTNLVMPGKRTAGNTMISTDIDGRLLNYTSNGDGTFTETEYSRFNGLSLGTTIVTSAKPHTHYLPILKPESEIEKVGWEDYQGGRLYGIYIEVLTDSDIEMHQCIGKGSPWGLHNTRGIYNNFGKVKMFNCIGVGGGIGRRLHGLIFHRTSESEAFDCIGSASPFAYITPSDVEHAGNSCGVKHQMMSSTVLTNCIGYGNSERDSHGFQADMRTQPKLINCIGYNGGGVDSAGLDISEYATIDVNGGYFGAHYKTSSFPFTKNQGNGMKMFPYKHPVRYGSTLDAVLYSNHWELILDNTTQSYKLINLTFTRSFQVTSSGLGGVARVVVYKVNGSTKTEISRTILENIDGNYQYMNVPPNVVIDAQNGDFLYVALENASGVEYTSIPNGFIEVAVNTTEVNEGLSAFYNQQLWSHETVIDPLNPQTNIVKNALINGAVFEQQIALRIGENAQVGGKYNVINSTLLGEIEMDSGSGSPKTTNCIQIIDGEVV